MSVHIKTQTVGQSFGTVGQVCQGGRILHETDVFPFGFTGPALTAAEEWAHEQGLQVPAHERRLWWVSSERPREPGRDGPEDEVEAS